MATDKDLFVLAGLARDGVLENQAAYRKVSAAARLWDSWIERDVQLGEDDIVDCGNNAIAEIAVRLGCSCYTAQRMAEVGMQLRLRLPLLREAFARGEIDYARTAAACHRLCGFSADTVSSVESEVVAAARGLAPGPLKSEIDRMLMRAAPDEYAELRADVVQHARRIRKTPDGELARITVDLEAAEAEAVWQRVCEVADTVCRHDRRGRQYRLVDAFMAIAHGENALACSCEREDCPVAGRAAPAHRRKPLVQITIDVVTLLGLVSNPAYLAGHGPIDPELARQLAADGTWQLLLVEATDMAKQLGLLDENGEPVAAEPAGDEVVPTDAAAPPVVQPRLPAAAGGEFCARGSRMRAGWVPKGPSPRARSVLGIAGMTELLETALGRQPARDYAVRQLAGPAPVTAVTYKPTAETAALVRARDQHCRFPGCRRPAANCQLDHVVPFRHDNPLAGGLTVVSNMQCLCAAHHLLKTLKLWHARMLPGGAIEWTSSYGDHHTTLPGGPGAGFERTLVPKIHQGPAKWQPPPPEPPPF
ncbi:HNH endonuclease signature motif containing protein [Skermania sp. ID1734]|uniref:HNH endonuclease signature motif containing protein n=1 Tax=Skermania sp. ID1734 TaxID=2597516 RepID=UPI00163DDBC2|nr:HNH endonuclease signature motif containing protein [Skermania sp. ID1734]